MQPRDCRILEHLARYRELDPENDDDREEMTLIEAEAYADGWHHLLGTNPSDLEAEREEEGDEPTDGKANREAAATEAHQPPDKPQIRLQPAPRSPKIRDIPLT